MVYRKFNCEREVSSQNLAVQKNNIFSKSSFCKKYNNFEKVGVLKK